MPCVLFNSIVSIRICVESKPKDLQVTENSYKTACHGPVLGDPFTFLTMLKLATDTSNDELK